MEFPLAIDTKGETDGLHVDFVPIRQTHSLADALADRRTADANAALGLSVLPARITVDYAEPPPRFRAQATASTCHRPTSVGGGRQ